MPSMKTAVGISNCITESLLQGQASQKPLELSKPSYDVVVIGNGYGGGVVWLEEDNLSVF